MIPAVHIQCISSLESVAVDDQSYMPAVEMMSYGSAQDNSLTFFQTF